MQVPEVQLPPVYVTVPLPVPLTVTPSGYRMGSKVAVAFVAAVTVTVQELALPAPLHAPDQPMK